MSFRKPRTGSKSGDTFYATLFSNATNKNSDNSTTKFTNNIARSIYLDPQDNWYFALVSLLCSNKFTTKYPKLVFSSYKLNEGEHNYNSLSQILVKCSLVSHPISGSGVISVHSRNPYNSVSNRVHYFEPQNLIYFKVNSSVIDDIEITLLDENHKQLSLARGLATSCTLKFMRMTDDNIVPLMINSHGPGSEPGNRSNNWINTLPSFFNNYSSMKWQICVSSVTYRPEFVLIPSHIVNNCFFALFEWPEGFSFNDIFATVNEEIPYETTHNRFYITEEVISKWSSEIDVRKFIQNVLRNELKSENGNPLKEFVEFERLIDRGDGAVYKKPITMKLIKPCLFFIPDFFANIMGFRNLPSHNAPTEYQSAALYKSAPERPKRIRARARMDVFQLIPHSISILVDFIEASIMGNAYSTVIKTFPILRTYGGGIQSETVESRNLEWHTLNTRELRTMSFKLLDHAGNPIEFVNNNQNIHISMLVKMYN